MDVLDKKRMALGVYGSFGTVVPGDYSYCLRFIIGAGQGLEPGLNFTANHFLLMAVTTCSK